MKTLELCDDTCYYIDEQDYSTLRRISPGLARLAKDTDGHTATHFVCEICGQICPLTLQELHDCVRDTETC